MAQYYTLDEAAAKLGLGVDAFRRKLATTDSATYSLGTTFTFTPCCSIACRVAGPIAAIFR